MRLWWIALWLGCGPTRGVSEPDGTEPPEPSEVVPPGAVALSGEPFDEVIVFEGRTWIQSGPWLLEAVEGRLEPLWFADPPYPARRETRGLLSGPGGRPWLLDPGLTLYGAGWSDGDLPEGLGTVVDWNRQGGVVALVDGTLDEDPCGDNDPNSPCPLPPRTLTLWTDEGTTSVSLPVAVVGHVAALSEDAWIYATGATVVDQDATSQLLDGEIADLDFATPELIVAGTANGTVWVGPAGALVDEITIGHPLVDVEVDGLRAVAVTRNGRAWVREDGLWAPLPVAPADDNIQKIRLDGDRLVGVGRRCLWEGDAQGLALVACGPTVGPVTAVTWSAGRLYAGGAFGLDRLGPQGPTDSWALPPVVGLAADDAAVQIVTEAGVFRLAGDALSPVLLPNGIDLSDMAWLDWSPPGTSGWTGVGRNDDVISVPYVWFHFDGRDWTAERVKTLDEVPVFTTDGARWTRDVRADHTRLYRQAEGGSPVELWRGPFLNELLALGEAVVLAHETDLWILDADGDVVEIGQARGPLKVEPSNGHLWSGPARWDGETWSNPDLPFPATTTAFSWDGRATVLDGDLWWSWL